MPRLPPESYGPRCSPWLKIWMNPAVAAELPPDPMLNKCALASLNSFRASARNPPPPVTLIQCCWPFRAWRRIEGVPLGQFHSHSHDLTEHLGLLRVTQDPNLNWRQRVRLQNDFLFAHAAPATGVTLAGFHKIDRALIFGTPGTSYHLISGLVDLNKTPRRQDGIHGEILGAHVTVSKIGVGELREVGDGHQSPLLDHPA